VHRAELKREIVRILKEKELNEENPEDTAESYLKAAADRAGLLEERGPEIFAFWHPTFEEYLAAVELTTPTSKAIRSLLPLRNDPRWREVILLAVGHVGIIQHDTETATEIVRSLAEDEPDVLEPTLHSHLRLVADCIADDVGVKRMLAQRIIVRLAEVIYVQPYHLLINSFVNTTRALPRLRPSTKTVSALVSLAKQESWEVRMETAWLFSNVAAENAEALSLCEQLLKDSDPDVRCHAAFGLARAGNYNPEVWQALARFQSNYAHIEPVVREFFAALPDEAISSLASCLSADNFNVRYQTASLLQRMGRADEKVVEALIPYLSADDFVRYQASELLREVDQKAMVVETTVRLLCPQPWIAMAACQRVMELQKLSDADGQALAELVRVQNHDDKAKRQAREWLFGWLSGKLEPQEKAK
jgi:hypothetical protein